jgi:hypothetical protein
MADASLIWFTTIKHNGKIKHCQAIGFSLRVRFTANLFFCFGGTPSSRAEGVSSSETVSLFAQARLPLAGMSKRFLFRRVSVHPDCLKPTSASKSSYSGFDLVAVFCDRFLYTRPNSACDFRKSERRDNFLLACRSVRIANFCNPHNKLVWDFPRQRYGSERAFVKRGGVLFQKKTFFDGWISCRLPLLLNNNTV